MRSEMRDVSARQRARSSNTAERGQLSALNELLPVIAWSADPGGGFTWVSEQWSRLTGLSANDALADGWTGALHPKDAESTAREWDRCIRIGAPFESVHRLRLRDGNFRWFRSRAVLERDSAGNAVQWHGITDDVHKLTETPERPPPDVVLRALHPEDKEWVQATVKRSYDPQLREIPTAEFRIVRPNGEIRWVAGRGRVVFDLSEEPPRPLRFVGVLLDVTERKIAEEEVSKTREDLARLNVELEKRVAERTAELKGLLGDVEQMSYSMIHDLRAPLRAINSYAQMLETTAAERLRPTEHDFLHRIQESAERMDTLVRQTLTYSGAIRRDLPVTSVNTTELLREIIRTSPEFQPPLAEIQTVGELPRVLANVSALAQCVRNLLGNAVKFVRPGTTPRVRIYAENVPANADSPAGPKNRWHFVRLWFEDNGLGLPREGRSKLFGMFERLHGPEYPGTGIGLALVRKFIERMGGNVGVESTPGQGSRFWLQLPSAHNASPDMPDPTWPAPPVTS